MQRWTALLLSGAFTIAFVLGFFIQPLDSNANTQELWQAEFYNNTELNGNPIHTRADRALNFNWANEAPALAVTTNQFSARWTASFHFNAGDWLFSVGADDGVRFWVDGTLLIDQWSPSGTFAVYTNKITLEKGIHDLRVEYYDLEGLAGLSVDWQPAPEEAPVDIITDAPPVNPEQDGGLSPVAHVATGRLNVRTGPGIQYTRIDQIFLYQWYPIKGQTPDGTWYLIDLKDGREGWVASRYIFRTGHDGIPVIVVEAPTPPAQGLFDGTDGISTARLNFREAPNTNNEPIGIIPYNADVTVLGRSGDSIWYYVDYDGVEGWVFAPYVDIQGFKVFDLPFIQ